VAITELYTGSAVTIGTTELSLVSGTTTLQSDTNDGIYQVWIEPVNMAANDEYTIRLYEKVIAASTKRVTEQWTLIGDITNNWVMASMILLHGWDVTMQKIAGTDRTFSWSIRRIA